MEIILQFSIAFFATISFALYFNSPIKSIVSSGLVGGSSWLLYYIILNKFDNKILGVILASFLAGILGEILAVKLRKPATIFITTGVIALVPGAGMYYTMLNLVETNFSQAAIFGTETFFVAAAIAIGIIISTVLSRLVKSFNRG